MSIVAAYTVVQSLCCIRLGKEPQSVAVQSHCPNLPVYNEDSGSYFETAQFTARLNLRTNKSEISEGQKNWVRNFKRHDESAERAFIQQKLRQRYSLKRGLNYLRRITELLSVIVNDIGKKRKRVTPRTNDHAARQAAGAVSTRCASPPRTLALRGKRAPSD